MDAPIFTQKIGTGQWIGTTYVIDVCPFCGDHKKMVFTGKGMWSCTGCKKGGKDLQSLREHFSENPLLKTLVPSIVDPKAPEEVIVVADYKSQTKAKTIGTGFGDLDYLLGGLTEGALTITTGKRGEGKSTFLGQVALNAIDAGHNVCFYSGELSATRFQAWLFAQAAGASNMVSFKDQFDANRYEVSEQAEVKIRKWLGEKMLLYDNTKAKASERGTILKSFRKARSYYGSDLYIVDNLMTAKYDIEDDADSLRAQANFAATMLDFARENNVHVILVAHPKKGDVPDINESVSGLGDITNMATNVIQIRKATDKEIPLGIDAVVTIAKNREYGDVGMSKLKFDKKSKRFMPIRGSYNGKYGWDQGS